MALNYTNSCIEIYESIRKEKAHRYIIYSINGDCTIDVVTVGARDNDYQQFLEDLVRADPSDCRYGLFDFEYIHQCAITGLKCKREKMVMLCWCPDSAKAKNKIKYLSTLQSFAKILLGLQHYLTANKPEDMSLEAVEKMLRASDK